MRQQPIKVCIDTTIQIITPKDMFTQSGEEFIVFVDVQDNRRELRADKITLM